MGRMPDHLELDGMSAFGTTWKRLAGQQGHFVGQAMAYEDYPINPALWNVHTRMKRFVYRTSPKIFPGSRKPLVRAWQVRCNLREFSCLPSGCPLFHA